ncbi:MAG: hypothetical protein LC662_13755 [Rhodothermaceae bacterium]|nr:hypothetical protein [Rhodothermaceae bacterium]
MNILCAIYLSFFILSGCVTGPDVKDPIDVLPPSEDFHALLGTWNADGTKILFQHDLRDGNTFMLNMLWVADLATGARYPVFGGQSLNPDWSKDEERILFHSNSAPSIVYTFDVPGQKLIKLTGSDSPNDTDDLRHNYSARWSPDNEKILFTTGNNKGVGVVIMNRDGSDADIVVPGGLYGNWFPDGQHVVYIGGDTTQVQGRRNQMYMSSVDGGNRVKLTDLPNTMYIGSPAVSPDGRRIAFMHQTLPGNIDIHILELQTGRVERLTYLREGAYRPVWHPDGHSILFSANIYNASRLYLIDINTREITAVFPE